MGSVLVAVVASSALHPGLVCLDSGVLPSTFVTIVAASGGVNTHGGLGLTTGIVTVAPPAGHP